MKLSGSGRAVREGAAAERTEEQSPAPGLLFPPGRRWASAAVARARRRVARMVAVGIGLLRCLVRVETLSRARDVVSGCVSKAVDFTAMIYISGARSQVEGG